MDLRIYIAQMNKKVLIMGSIAQVDNTRFNMAVYIGSFPT